eukprot:18146_1
MTIVNLILLYLLWIVHFILIFHPLQSPLNPLTPINHIFPLTSSTPNISIPANPTSNNHTQNIQLAHFYDPSIYKNSDNNINNNNNTYNNNNYTDLDDGISFDTQELLACMD